MCLKIFSIAKCPFTGLCFREQSVALIKARSRGEFWGASWGRSWFTPWGRGQVTSWGWRGFWSQRKGISGRRIAVNDSLCLWHLWQTLWVDFIIKHDMPIICPDANPIEVNRCNPPSPLLLLHSSDHQVALPFNCVVHQSSASVLDSINCGVENLAFTPSPPHWGGTWNS